MRFKSWFILLLAFVLPLKGVMAAGGVLCHVPGQPTARAGHVVPAAQELPADATAHDDHASHGGRAVHAVAALADASPSHGSHAAADGQAAEASCQACAAVCGACPLPPAVADRVPEQSPARDWSVVAEPEPPRLTLAALERPPRAR